MDHSRNDYCVARALFYDNVNTNKEKEGEDEEGEEKKNNIALARFSS